MTPKCFKNGLTQADAVEEHNAALNRLILPLGRKHRHKIDLVSQHQVLVAH